jgi:hypothetical protein
MPWVLAYSFSRHDGGDELESETESSTGSMPQGRATRTCSLAGATGKAMGQVPITFDRRDLKDPFVRILKKSIRYGEMVVLRHGDPELPSWIFEMRSGSDNSGPSHSALLIPIRPTPRNDIEGQNVIGFLIVGLAAARDYDKDYHEFAQLCTRQLATSAASIMLLEQEIRHQEQLAQQLSISSRQARDLEMKLSHFADISNIGMYVYHEHPSPPLVIFLDVGLLIYLGGSRQQMVCFYTRTKPGMTKRTFHMKLRICLWTNGFLW